MPLQLLIVCLITFFFISSLHSQKTNVLYSFSKNTDALIQLAFPTNLNIRGLSKGWMERQQTPHFSSFNELLNFNIQGNHIGNTNIRHFVIPQDHLDSVWFWKLSHHEKPSLVEFVQKLPRIEGLLDRLITENFSFSSVFEKALFQRDTFQLFCITYKAWTEYKKGKDSPLWSDELNKETESQLRKTLLKEAALLKKILFSQAERQTLFKKIQTTSIGKPFITRNTFDLNQDYLPDRVVRENSDWMEFTTREPLDHFLSFSGRSFFRAFFKAPGFDEKKFFSFWDMLYFKFGNKLHLHSSTAKISADTETLLLRTIGLFLEDGRYFDSHLPEEVLMRIFKYPSQKLFDYKTSDYRGTLLYHYKLQRKALLQQQRPLGLVRRDDNEFSFPGFMSEVPQIGSLSATVITTRANCISCHSELYYGNSTIFSFEKKRSVPGPVKNDYLSPKQNNTYQLNTPEARYLRELLKIKFKS